MPFPIDKSVVLSPLINSFENNQIESEFKAMFMALFSKLSSQYFDATVQATPQLGSSSLVKNMLAYNGLSVLNSSMSEDELKYILKMWLGNNSARRGLTLIKSYLQVLYPNSIEINQLMQLNNLDYGTGNIYATDRNIHDTDKFLTSRVEFNLENASIENIQSNLSRLFNDILPAKFVPVFKVFGSFEVIVGEVEVLALDIYLTIKDINPLILSEINPFNLLHETVDFPAYSLSEFNRKLIVDGFWFISDINSISLLSDTNNGKKVIIDNHTVLDVMDTGRLVLDDNWTISENIRTPDFSMVVG